MIFRASSEIAVAMNVRSLGAKASCAASSRPLLRAATISASELMGTRNSSATSASVANPLHLLIQVREALLQVQTGGDVLQHQAELNHRERDLRLDPDD